MTKRKAPPSPDLPFKPHEVWMAGLSALTQAQQQGRQAVQDLVQQGEALQQHAQAQWSELTQRMANPFAAVAPSANKLEGIFEQRVAQALHGMGMPNAADVRALQEEVLALNARLAALEQAAAAPEPAPRRSSSRSTRATPSRKA
jgi:poly(hydroxyalkanoate) granule-associated protein